LKDRIVYKEKPEEKRGERQFPQGEQTNKYTSQRGYKNIFKTQGELTKVKSISQRGKGEKNEF